MTPEDMYLAALLGLVENLRCGVTTVVQHHKLPGRAHVDAACRAAAEVGIRMTLARGWVDLGASGEPLDAILAEMQWLHDTWRTGKERVAASALRLVRWRRGAAPTTRCARSRRWPACGTCPRIFTWPRRRTRST